MSSKSLKIIIIDLKLQLYKSKSWTVYGVNPSNLYNKISSVNLPVNISFAINYSFISIEIPSKTFLLIFI